MKNILQKLLVTHYKKLVFSGISGTLVALNSTTYAQEAQTKLLTWGAKHKLDVFLDEEPSRDFEVVDLILATEVEAAIDENGKVHVRSGVNDTWVDSGFFGAEGWLSSYPKAAQASAHFDRLFIVDENGCLWERQENSTFKEMKFPEKIREVKVAEDRVAVVTEKGQVYFSGSNEFGQSGLGNMAHTEGEFVAIPESYFHGQVLEVALGGRHSLFRTSLGHVYSCGSNDNMQLGLPWTREKVWLANEDWVQIVELPAKVQVELLEKQEALRSYYDTKTLELRPRVCMGKVFDGFCKKIVAGENHSAALIAKNLRTQPELCTWGSSMRGQLGHRNTTNMAEPNSVSMLLKYDEFDPETNTTRRCTPTQIAAGANHTLIVMKGPISTLIFGLGDNTEQQISTVRQRKFTQPVWLKKICPMNGLEGKKVFAGQNKSAIFCKKVDLLSESIS